MSLVEFTQLASIVAGVVVGAFVLIYSVVARWWRSQEGQNVMLMSLLILAAVNVGIIGRAGHIDLARALGAGVWWGVAVVYVWRTWLLLRAQSFLLNRREPPTKG